jgi:predicted RNA-binding protein with PUA-like domain/DNA polymerase III delta prime subunit
MDKKFTWVQTHKQLTQYLAEQENSQKELIELLREAGVTAGLVDEDPKGNRFDLEEIDPFSFFCFIYKYGPEKRLQILQSIAKKLELHYPEDESGIPSAQAQKVMMFPFRHHRNDNEIENLWQFFYSALDGSITDEQFENILNQYGVGPVKITEALFYIAPDRYMPINGPVKPWLKQKLDIDPSFSTYSEYLELLEKIKQATSKPFYELSYDGWLWTDKQKKKDAYREKFEPLIDRYKLYLEEFGLEKEQYKWEAIRHFQQTFNIEADDFTENFKEAVSKASNLVYQNSIGFIRKAVEYFPEDVREMFRTLYDEVSSLEDRRSHFTKSAEELLPKVIEKHGKKLNHQQDERTLSYYLTMRFPEKYPLYKNETYKYLLTIMGDLDAKSAGEKYFHYLELTEKLVFTVESEDELIKMVESLLTEECYQGEQKWIVLQDILWVNMRFINQANYWLFQGNPNVFDLEKALKDNALSTWRVNAHKSRITPGDKVILWASGNDGGCYALAEVVSEVYEDSVHEDEIQYYKNGYEEDNYDQVQLQITHNIARHPIALSQIKSDPRLEDLKIGNQGTNFSATEEEFEALIELAEGVWDDKWKALVNVVSKIDDEEAVRKFFATIRHVLNKFGLSVDDQIIYASAINKYVQFTIGSRYVTHLERKKGKVSQGFYVGNDHLEELQDKLPSLKISDKAAPLDEGEMTWVYMNAEEVNIEDFFEGIDALARKGIEGQSKSQFRSIYPDKHNPWIGKVAMDNDLLDKLLKGEKMADHKQHTEVNYPLNTIFYGPPGTGKTYTTIKRAAEIVEGRLIDKYNEAKEIFSKNLGDTIEFITFHQNYSYEDFIQGLRPDIESTNELNFNRVDGIFKEICDRALKNLKESEKPITKKKSFDTVFSEFISPLVEGEVEEIEVERKRVSFLITNVTERSIEFNKASGNSNHTLSIRTLKKMYDSESLMNIQGLSGYYSPLLDKLLEMGKTPGVTEIVDKKNYVLIIDEINRANISRVFGELITLIEPDKRYGREFHIPAKLPSGESFSVPENLYIIGTMNTADKSIALLDIALRRRFDFEAMYPLYEINGEKIHDVDVLKKINERIIKLKVHDFQIGHSYFMKNHITLDQRMNRKVIPLLLEYFMNDEAEVRSILEHAGLNIIEKSWPLRINGMK